MIIASIELRASLTCYFIHSLTFDSIQTTIQFKCKDLQASNSITSAMSDNSSNTNSNSGGSFKYEAKYEEGASELFKLVEGTRWEDAIERFVVLCCAVFLFLFHWLFLSVGGTLLLKKGRVINFLSSVFLMLPSDPAKYNDTAYNNFP